MRRKKSQGDWPEGGRAPRHKQTTSTASNSDGMPEKVMTAGYQYRIWPTGRLLEGGCLGFRRQLLVVGKDHEKLLPQRFLAGNMITIIVV